MTSSALAHSVTEIADLVGAVRVDGPATLEVRSVAALDDAGSDAITFIGDAKHARRWGASGAAAAVISEGLAPTDHDPAHRTLIWVKNAERAVVDLLHLFAPPVQRPELGVHPTAWVHDSARLGAGVSVGPHVSIERDCEIGDGVVLHAGVRLYESVRIGAGSVLHANVVVRERCLIGRNVLIHQNVSIGADGFGFVPDPKRGLIKVPQIGIVRIEDDVEIGAGSCIDRAKFDETVIGAGTKIDDLVLIAHNVKIGRSCAIAGLVGIAGSSRLGDGVLLGGEVGVIDNLTVGSGASLGAGSLLVEDVPPGESWLGYPARRASETLRQWASMRKLPGLVQQLERAARSSAREGGREPRPLGAEGAGRAGDESRDE